MNANPASPSQDAAGRGPGRATRAAPTTADDAQTLEEVSYSSHQFKGVRTLHDLAVLEYCAAKLLAAICELKVGAAKQAVSEEGTLVQIRIKKREVDIGG